MDAVTFRCSITNGSATAVKSCSRVERSGTPIQPRNIHQSVRNRENESCIPPTRVWLGSARVWHVGFAVSPKESFVESSAIAETRALRQSSQSLAVLQVPNTRFATLIERRYRIG